MQVSINLSITRMNGLTSTTKWESIFLLGIIEDSAGSKDHQHHPIFVQTLSKSMIMLNESSSIKESVFMANP